MECHRIQDLFTDYSDRNLDPTLHDSLENHVQQCTTCREAWEGFHHTLRLLHELPPASPPPDLLHGIHQKLARPSLLQRLATRLNPFPLPIPAPAAAALMTMTVLALVVFQAMPPSTPVPSPSLQHSPGESRQVAAIPQPFQSPGQVVDRQAGYSARLQTPVILPPDQYYMTSQAEQAENTSCFPGLFPPEQVPSMKYSPFCQEGNPEHTGLAARITLANTAQVGSPLQPDVTFTLRTSAPETIQLLRQHLSAKKWQSQFYQNRYLLMLVHPHQLAELQQWLDKLGMPYSSRVTETAASHSAKGLLLIAIRSR